MAHPGVRPRPKKWAGVGAGLLLLTRKECYLGLGESGISQVKRDVPDVNFHDKRARHVT